MNGMRRLRMPIGLLLCVLLMGVEAADRGAVSALSSQSHLWRRDNLVVSGLVDARSRTADERAQLLKELGFTQVTLGGAADDSTLDRQIEAMQRQGIKIFGWFIYDTRGPTLNVDWKSHVVDAPEHGSLTLESLLKTFRRHGIQPQLWLTREMQLAKGEQKSQKPGSQMTADEKNLEFRKYVAYDLPPEEGHAARVQHEIDHLRPLAQLASSFGLDIALYKHAGWLSIEENTVEVIAGLKRLGVKNVGIVYRFIHAHDEVDDTRDFAALWTRIYPDVRVVDLTGLHEGRATIYPILYPSQGDLELEMMRIIQDSGWHGTVGVSGEKGAEVPGDLEINLRNNLIGVDWLASELKQPGSGGDRPLGHLP